MRLWNRRNWPAYLDEGPVSRPRDWRSWVNGCESDAELRALRQSAHRGVPYGDAAWVTAIAVRLGLESTVRGRGRPRTRAVGE
jgi:putative transposase